MMPKPVMLRITGLVAIAALVLVASAGPGSAGVAVLADIDSGLPSPTGIYRWLDIADQEYGIDYQTTYDYTQASVQIQFSQVDTILQGVVVATGLKPNFSYQLKLVGEPGTAINESIGYTGRWWQEEWLGGAWTGGQNLNSKGDGTFPNPNDLLYQIRRNIPDPTSPTGLNYRFTGYLVFAYLVTDSLGNATVPYEANSSFHVLWNTDQRVPSADDGPVIVHAFDPDTLLHPAYSTDYSPETISVYGEWERLPMGGVTLPLGTYACTVVLTEESFHGSGGSLAGAWAAAMGGDLSFEIVDEVTGVGIDTPRSILRLERPHPNPFRARTEIVYAIPAGSPFAPMVDVLDVTGRRVVVLSNGSSGPGAHRLTWTGTGAHGQRVAPGVYFVRLRVAGQPAVSRSVVVLR